LTGSYNSDDQQDRSVQAMAIGERIRFFRNL